MLQISYYKEVNRTEPFPFSKSSMDWSSRITADQPKVKTIFVFTWNISFQAGNFVQHSDANSDAQALGGSDWAPHFVKHTSRSATQACSAQPDYYSWQTFSHTCQVSVIKLAFFAVDAIVK